MRLKDIYYKISDLTSVLKELKPYTLEIYNRADDMAFGTLFADVFENIIRYNATNSLWYVYDGKVWKKDEGGMIVEGLAKDFSSALYIASVEAPEHFKTSVCKLGRRASRTSMIKDAMSCNFITTDKLDQDDNLLNLQNGILDLNTFEIHEHDSKHLMSKIANVSFDSSSRSESFEKFFAEIMQNDEEKMRYIQKLLGYCLTAEVNREEMYFAYGATARNGKSTLLETIGNMLGDYTCSISPESLAETNNDNGAKPNPEIARLPGIRFLRAPEPKKRMLFNVNLIKRMTGRDVITVRTVFEKPFDFTPKYKLIINTNSLPVVTDETLFSGNRVKVITFNRHFEPSEQDLTLKDKLNTPQSLSGILNWCIEGLKLYRAEGLEAPCSVLRATEEYKLESDKLSTFIKECMKPSEKNTPGKEFYDKYKSWCDASGMFAEKKTSVFNDLRARGILAASGTVQGRTQLNVVVGYVFLEDGETNSSTQQMLKATSHSHN